MSDVQAAVERARATLAAGDGYYRVKEGGYEHISWSRRFPSDLRPLAHDVLTLVAAREITDWNARAAIERAQRLAADLRDWPRDDRYFLARLSTDAAEALEALIAVLIEAERERDENEGVFKIWRRRTEAAEARVTELKEARSAYRLGRISWQEFLEELDAALAAAEPKEPTT